MNINEFLRKVLDRNIGVVPIGEASTPQELFDNCISVPYPCDDKRITNAIIGWHNLLSWYAKQDGAILLSRLYESEKDDNDWNNRRNSLTISKNYSYAFCSNFFARVIMTMALNGFVPSKEDFWETMVTKRSLYLGSMFGLTRIEKRISAYSQKVYGKELYTPGWYLAHIIAVNNMAYKEHDDIDLKKIFKLGNESEWNYEPAYGCIVRRNNDEISEREREIAIAHFLRCLDPMNYFLVPNRNNVVYKKINSDDGSPLGENKKVVQFMLIKSYDRFGEAFTDFLRLSLADIDICSIYGKKTEIASARISAKYAPNINKTSYTTKYTDDEELKVVSYYLRNKSGLINVEKAVLHLVNNRGWVAKEILNRRGIDTSSSTIHKGLLIKSDLDVEISRASGILKKTLEEIKKRGL